MDIKSMLLYAGLPEAEFKKIHKYIQRKNYHSVRITSAVGFYLLLFLCIICNFIPVLTKNRILYAVTCSLMLLINIYLRTVLKDRPQYSLIAYYVFLAVSYGFAIILGVPMLPNTPATSICVLLFALPLLICDSPIRISMFLASVAAVFCVSTKIFKNPTIASLDVVNCICFLGLGIIVNYFVMETKFRELSGRVFIEKERDTDAMTGLLVKSAATKQITDYMSVPGRVATLMMLDIDNFKTINDTLGHAYGDANIHIMGTCITDVFRKSDILSRFGGDEFIVFLPGVSDEAIIKARVDKLVANVEERLSSNLQPTPVTTSIGIAVFPKDATTYDELFEKADKALYDAKSKGKNCYTIYDDSLTNTDKAADAKY